MDNTIILSICMPVYNRCQILRQQLIMLNDEDLSNVEVIVSDNNSADGTWEMLEESVLEFSWLKASRNESNVGAENNIRKLIKNAHGKYVLLFGDDELEKGSVGKIVRILRENDISLLHFDYTEEYDNIHPEFYQVKNKAVKVPRDDLVQIISKQITHLMFMSVNVYRRSDILECLDFDVEYSSNLLYSICALSKGTLYYYPHVLIHSNADITWKENKYSVWFNCIPMILEFSAKYGFSADDICYMMDNHMAQKLLACKRHLGEVYKYLNKYNHQNYINMRVIRYFIGICLKDIYSRLKRKIRR